MWPHQMYQPSRSFHRKYRRVYDFIDIPHVLFSLRHSKYCRNAFKGVRVCVCANFSTQFSQCAHCLHSVICCFARQINQITQKFTFYRSSTEQAHSFLLPTGFIYRVFLDVMQLIFKQRESVRIFHHDKKA